MEIIRTNSSNQDFKKICNQLDKELNARYGHEQAIYDEHNIIEENKTVIVGYINEIPMAIGCFKQLDKDIIEIKRMYVSTLQRKKGFALKILSELEKWAKELGYSTAVLETGKKQPEAISLYKKANYEVTDNYGPYVGIENSVCMKKIML
ncbi:N-acetyltransferase [Desulfosarcina alkanivorans]|uniref:N-acetyltransferase n=2 Tax=Desulfosarcina alkanivorans TaxID=571177 RepID=A0A5K7YJT3_9BACT|nr:N-acetyltransferase [Desulfosarcina alkanivorans]